MQYIPPINGNTADPNRSYINGNPGAGIEGSIPPGSAFEHVQREILNVITGAGHVPSGAALNQLLLAINQLITNAGGIDVFTSRRLEIADEKATNTPGGTFTSGAYRTRDLNTVKTNQIPGASLAANQITLPGGNYFCMGSAVAYSVDGHRTRLYNVTDNLVLVKGQNAKTDPAGGGVGMNPSIFVGPFSLGGTRVIELQHRGITTQASVGFGTSFNFADNEVYSNINIWKV